MSSSQNLLGSISKPVISHEFEWSIYTTCDILETDTYWESPTFSFSDCCWCVRMFPKGDGFSSNEWLSLFLVKKESESEKNISFSLFITVHGIPLIEYTATSTYIFKKEENRWGWPRCLPRKEFRSCWPMEEITWLQLSFKMRLYENASSKKDTLLEVKMQDKLLHQNYKDLLLHDMEHDLTLNVQGMIYKVHQNIMQFRCPVFKSMLAHDMLEKNKGLVEIPDCYPLAFEQFLLYVYTGNVETIDESFMLNLYYIADKYDMACLKEICSEFIKKSLSIHNISDVIRLALNHCDSSLLESGNIYFAANAKEVLVTAEWRSFMNENPNQANELFLKTINYYKPE